MKAYMSYLKLHMENSNFELDGKLSALWFDQLLLGEKEKDIEHVIEMVADMEHWSKDTIKEVKKIQISANKVLPDVSFIINDKTPEDYYDKAWKLMRKHYSEELSSKESYAGAMHEVVMGGAAIAETVSSWMLLSAKESCTFLPINFERLMLQQIFSESFNIGFQSFSNIMTGIIPDISEYSWDEIIELRHHHYWEQFRDKISILNNANSDKVIEKEVFNEIVHKDLIEMAQNFKPSIKKNIVKGFISNIPLPIPINPASVICAGLDIKKEIDFEKKYGWLYFYLDNKKV